VWQQSLYEVVPSLTDDTEKATKLRMEKRGYRSTTIKKMYATMGGRESVGGNVISVVHRGRKMFK